MDIMTETLPITIKSSDDLIDQISNIASICNKLEAQLNFHTMTANWYGEEENVLLINFQLISINEYNHPTSSVNQVFEEALADDVRLLSSTNDLVDCQVAITLAEFELIKQQPKILSGYLAKKLTKILNLIADKYQLEHI